MIPSTLHRGLRAIPMLWRAWVRELESAFEDARHGLSPSRRRRLRIDVGTEGWTLSLGDTIREELTLPSSAADESVVTDPLRTWVTTHALQGARCLVVLPESAILRRRLRLNAAVAASLAEVVALQLPRVVPLAPNVIHHDHRLIDADRDDDQIEVEIGAVRRSTVATLIARITQAGLVVDRIAAPGSSSDTPQFQFLSSETRRAQSGSLAWTPIERGLGATAVSLAAILMAVWILQNARERTAWEEALAAADAASAPAEKASRRLLAQLTPAQALVGAATEPTVGEALSTLSTLVPGDTWVSQWEWRDGAVAMRALTPNASTLIQALDDSPLTRTVRLRSANPAAGIPGLEDAQIELSLDRAP